MCDSETGHTLRAMLQLLRASDLGRFLGYRLPLLRICRELRCHVEVLHLRNVLWGRECVACDRAGGRTWVFVDNVRVGGISFFECFRCVQGDHDV